MNCFMFPGQPLALPASLPDDALFREVAEVTLERTGLDLATSSWKGEPGSENVKLQVYGAALGVYGARLLEKDGITPRYVAEHSMGIYAALAAVGSLSGGDAIEIAYRAGCAMQAMSRRMSCAIGCVVGLTVEPLLAIAENNGVYLANHNTSRHFLLSGERAGMEAAEAEALAAGAFSAKLFPCDAPLHTPLMEELASECAAIFADYSYRAPSVPLVDHIEGEFLSAAEIPGYLSRELSEPVYWERSYRTLRSLGVQSFREVGLGDSLKKYNRWIDAELGR